MKQKRIQLIILLIFSLIFSVGMLYALYRDLNFFVTKRFANAEITGNIKASNSNHVSLDLHYYNDYLKKNINANISMNQPDESKYLITGNNHISILYAKNFPYKIYVEEINAPRWPILLFEVIMVLLMIFLFVSSLKNLFKKQ